MPHPVALEPFPLSPKKAAERDSIDPVALADTLATREPDPGLLPESDPGSDPETDPEAERRACLARIATALESIARDQAALRARWITDAAAALGGAAESLLPRLARAGFAALVADTVTWMARDGRWPGLMLCAASEDAGDIVEALKAAGVRDIELRPDPALEAGTVHLAWERGGAELDVEAIASAAFDQFKRALAAATDHGA